ncbi:hypothetical protein AAFX91_29635 [Bradyrhizobium sp. 31Argb]|uniref:hypothetical protein n=1 Tax=Bradyrhizobium sp. 31Argb TaxID=3141247 RepID=UPI003749F47F
MRAFEKTHIHAKRLDEIAEDDVRGLHEDVMNLGGGAISPIDLPRVTAKKQVAYHAG